MTLIALHIISRDTINTTHLFGSILRTKQIKFQLNLSSMNKLHETVRAAAAAALSWPRQAQVKYF